MANETKLAVILHADVVGSTRLVQQDEQLAHERMQNAFHRFSAIAANNHGKTHEVRGDALVAEFERASDATTAALTFQVENATHNESLDGEVRPVCRIGIALGEVIIADGTVTGTGVVLAQRLEQLAVPGGVCISAAIREAVPGRLGLGYSDLGEHQLKGFEQPQRAYAVSPGEQIRPSKISQAPLEGGMNPDKASIAVLPFENMSNDPEQDYFADGMAEDIITSLSRYRSLFVIARNSTFAYKEQSPDLRDVSRELGVRYVLEGSVRKGGNRVRVTAQLIEGESGNHIWAERYDGELDDIFALQDKITETIVSAIGPEIDQVERQRAKRLPPENLNAWELCQRGLWHLYRFNREDNEIAQRLFIDACNDAPNFAPAFSGLTHAMYYAFMHGYTEDWDASIDRAYENGRAAVAADERDADAHFALGRILYLRREFPASLKEFETAIVLNPNFAHAYLGHGGALLFDGRFFESIEACDQAARLSPHDPVMWTIQTIKALSLIGLSEIDRAVAVGRECTRQPNAPWTAYMAFASALGHAGERDEGTRVLGRISEMKPDFKIDDVRRILTFRDASHLELVVEGIRHIGLET